MKKFISIIIVICLAFLVIGAILSFGVKILPRETYLLVAGLIAGFCSVVSLISLSLPRLTAKDIEVITSERIKNIEKMNDELKQLSEKLETKKEDVDKLELLHKQLPLIVNRAIQISGTKEQLKQDKNRLFKIIDNNDELKDIFNRLRFCNDTLKAFDEEIDQDQNLAYVINCYEKYRFRENDISVNISLSPIDVLSRLFRNLYK
jgi:septal ring factor EnvC (AmiA/AmiB activator)